MVLGALPIGRIAGVGDIFERRTGAWFLVIFARPAFAGQTLTKSRAGQFSSDKTVERLWLPLQDLRFSKSLRRHARSQPSGDHDEEGRGVFAHECLVFEVCQPQQAEGKVLNENMSVSTALPGCRISIYEGRQNHSGHFEPPPFWRCSTRRNWKLWRRKWRTQ